MPLTDHRLLQTTRHASCCNISTNNISDINICLVPTCKSTNNYLQTTSVTSTFVSCQHVYLQTTIYKQHQRHQHLPLANMQIYKQLSTNNICDINICLVAMCKSTNNYLQTTSVTSTFVSCQHVNLQTTIYKQHQRHQHLSRANV